MHNEPKKAHINANRNKGILYTIYNEQSKRDNRQSQWAIPLLLRKYLVARGNKNGFNIDFMQKFV